jgi:hypothetical protein
MAFDSVRSRVVLTGGQDSGPLADTWEWDGVAWIRRFPAANPASYFCGAAYDVDREQVVFFDGETWVYAASQPARFTAFGAGCSGSAGVPALAAAANQRPWSGERFVAELTNLPPGNSALLWLGFSKTSWASVQLPLDLGSAGMPGCSLLVAAQYHFPVFNLTGGGSTTLQIPDDAALVGAPFYLQGLVADRAANALGATSSNAAEGRIGGK